MFVRQPQFRNSNADVKIFYGDGSGNGEYTRAWNKPPGVSHVYMMLIGAGGTGDGTAGGGSGAVTVWYGAAQNVPDNLLVSVGTSITRVGFRNTSTTITQLVGANAASGISGGTTTAQGVFGASGFYQSIAGQGGSSGASSASSTTFLSGGGNLSTVTANYGYTASSTSAGYFLLQPIIVGLGSSNNGNKAGIGCGGSYAGDANAGQGMALIASW